MMMHTESLRPATQMNAPIVVTMPRVDAVEEAPRTVERRGLERVKCRNFFVAGAELDVQRVLFGLLPWMSATSCEVDNLSKGGVAFECRFAMMAGEALHMQLWVPGQAEPVVLKGEVRWCKRARYGNAHRVGVQFAPFGTASNMNSREALDALRALEANNS